MLQNVEADDPDIRRPQPSRVRGLVGHHVLHPFPGPAQLRSAQAWHEHGPVSTPAFLHERLRAADVARLAAVPRVDGAGAHAADVRREEYIQALQTTTKNTIEAAKKCV